MANKLIPLLIVSFTIGYIFLTGCNKCQSTSDNVENGSPYKSPIWYPGGSFLAFNHTAVASSVLTNADCSPFSSVKVYTDSSGFWFVNKDGTNIRMVLKFQLQNPAWSPDGKWIAFSKAGICKMAFDGKTFDTANIIHLTDNTAAYSFASWNAAGDSIYYQSNKDSLAGTGFYEIWKMATDGSGQKRISDSNFPTTNGTATQPFCSIYNLIIYLRVPIGTDYSQIFAMDADGNNVKQLMTNPGIHDNIYSPRIVNDKIYYENFGVWSANIDGSEIKKIISLSTNGFSISKFGTIAYVNFDGRIIDKTHGTIWVTDINGNNAKPLVFNNY